jgi:hypothetical protein
MVLALGVRYIGLNDTTFMKKLIFAQLFSYDPILGMHICIFAESQSRASLTGAYGGRSIDLIIIQPPLMTAIRDIDVTLPSQPETHSALAQSVATI